MVNVHAYKTVYALKELAEDLLYEPEDLISDESSSESILKDGFRVLIEICQVQARHFQIRILQHN